MTEVFKLHGAWRLIYQGMVPVTTWAEKGPAEAQLDLLKSGYSVLTPDGRIKHVGAKASQGAQPGLQGA